jgi:hypothetical protein
MRWIVIGLMLLATPALAQTKKPDPLTQFNNKLKSDFTKTTGVPATGDLPFDLLQALDVKLLPDLQYSLLLATATKNTITANCYQAWINIIQVQQTAVQNASGVAIEVPTPHIITDFERLVEIRNMLQPDSPFMTACSPVANMVKVDVTNFIGLVVGGGASLSALVPGL